MDLSSHLPIDIDVAKVYRSGAIRNWMLSYFKFTESPAVISTSTHQKVTASCRAAFRILEKVSSEVIANGIELNGRTLADTLDIPNHIFYWIKKFHDEGTSKRLLFWGRPDFHICNGNPFLLEANFASAAGYQQQVAGLYDYYTSHPEFFDAFEEGGFSIWNPMQGLASAFSKVAKSGDVVLIPDILEQNRHPDLNVTPYGGLVSWFNLNTQFRFVSDFAHQLEFKKDGIYCRGAQVDHVYMSYYNPHVFDRFDEFLPLWDLALNGKVNIVDSMDEVLWSNKLLMAFIDEEIDSLGLDTADVNTWKSSVPWTRILRAGKTSYRGETIDIARFARKAKDNLVLKKAQSAEGKLVFVGRSVPQDNWDEAIAKYTSDGNWILQEFVEPDPVSLMVPDDDDYTDVEALQTISPFMTGLEVVGYLNRFYALSPEESAINSASVTKLNPVGTTVVQNEARLA